MDIHNRTRRASRRQAQRGAVAIIVGLSIAVLIGFLGLALDTGHLYVTKTELQNGADACALAASHELTDAPAIMLETFQRADAAGMAVATRHFVGFQGSAIPAGNVAISYSADLEGAWAPSATAPGDARYVRCTIERTGISPWFMQVLGFGDQAVRSLATATLAPSQANCAVPMALCVQPGSTAPDYGYVVGNWYSMEFEETGGAANYTGNFRWIDFDPSSTSPGCSGGGGGGANELACLLAGSGQCSLPPPITGSCTTSGNSSPTPGCVGQNGAINALRQAYNTRFGIYGPGSYTSTTAAPDFTGFSYAWEQDELGTWRGNWPLGRNAYDGTVAGVPNFRSARLGHMPANDGSEVTPNLDPLFYRSPPFHPTPQPGHASSGADRRVVVVPIIDCAGMTGGGQHGPIRAYACVLMVDPYRLFPGNRVMSRLEYLGRSDVPGSPCATAGVVGDANSSGPMVPALVQ